MTSECILVKDLVATTGLSRSVVQGLRNGRPSLTDQRQGQKWTNPRINTFAALAHGLNQRLSFVLSWGGLEDKGERFTQAERRVLAELLGGAPEDTLLRLRTQTKETH